MLLYRATELVGYPAVRGYFRPEVTGLEHVLRTGAAIIAANHLSAADEVFTPVSARRQVVYFAKAEYFTRPGLRGRFVSRLFREFGHVPVDRADTHAAASTIKTGVELLADGKALGIYPEGTRSPDGRLYKFHTGVARLALRSGAPVIPVGLVGTDQVLTAGDRRWHRSPVAVHFGPALDFSGRAADERSAPIRREITETVRGSPATVRTGLPGPLRHLGEGGRIVRFGPPRQQPCQGSALHKRPEPCAICRLACRLASSGLASDMACPRRCASRAPSSCCPTQLPTVRLSSDAARPAGRSRASIRALNNRP